MHRHYGDITNVALTLTELSQVSEAGPGERVGNSDLYRFAFSQASLRGKRRILTQSDVIHENAIFFSMLLILLV